MSNTGIPVYTVAGIREIIEFLYAQKVPVMIEGEPRPIDEAIKTRFDEYLMTYGTG